MKRKLYRKQLILLAFCFILASCLGDPPRFVRLSSFGNPSAELQFYESKTTEVSKLVECRMSEARMTVTGKGYSLGRVILRMRFDQVKTNELFINPRNIRVEDEILGNVAIAYSPTKQKIVEALELFVYFGEQTPENNDDVGNNRLESHRISITFPNVILANSEHCSLDTIKAEYFLSN